MKDGGVVEFGDLIVVGQSFGCGFAVNAAEAAAGVGGFVVDGFAKFEKATSESFGELRQYFSFEQDERQSEAEDDFTAAEVEQSEVRQHG